MSRAKIEVIDTGNIGLYANFGSESEDDDWERKAIEKEDEEIRDFVRCHPMPWPSPDDVEGKKVIDRMNDSEKANRMVIYSFVRFDSGERSSGPSKSWRRHFSNSFFGIALACLSLRPIC